MSVTASDVTAARAAVEKVARRTPILSTRTFSERAGGTVVLKAENLQRTGSFKVRGVAAKLAALGDGCNNGVVAGYPVVDTIVRITDGSFHEVDSSEMAFKMAGIFGFKEAMKKASPILLEPIMAVEEPRPLGVG